jgi:hypothetical protein
MRLGNNLAGFSNIMSIVQAALHDSLFILFAGQNYDFQRQLCLS